MLKSDTMIRGTPNTVLPGGERVRNAVRIFTVRPAMPPGAYKKQHARESVFRSERMPESIDHHTAGAVWIQMEEENETC